MVSYKSEQKIEVNKKSEQIEVNKSEQKIEFGGFQPNTFLRSLNMRPPKLF